MALIHDDPPGATPLDPDEAAGLIPAHITQQAQLNEWEMANILAGERWARPAQIQFDDETLRDGLQSPSVKAPTIDEKIRILHLMDRLGLNTAEAKASQIQLIDKGIDRPDRIILGQIVVQPLRKQRALAAVIPNDKARHRIFPPNLRKNHIIERRFHTALPKADIYSVVAHVRS